MTSSFLNGYEMTLKTVLSVMKWQGYEMTVTPYFDPKTA